MVERVVLDGLVVVEAARAGRVARLGSRPPHDEMGEQLKSGKAFFPDGVEERHIPRFFYFGLGIGIVRFAVHEMVRLRVVLGVRVLPGIVRDQ